MASSGTGLPPAPTCLDHGRPAALACVTAPQSGPGRLLAAADRAARAQETTELTGSRRKTVLISEPHAVENPAPFLPYIWAILKSYWERHGDDAGHYEWQPPIFLNRDTDALLRPYEDVTIDVLGLSCYTWNWARQCDIARRVKERS